MGGIRRLLAVLVGAGLAVPVMAADVTGTWALRADGQAAALLEIGRDAGGRWTASRLAPERLVVSPSLRLTGLGGPLVRRELRFVKAQGERLLFELPAAAGEAAVVYEVRPVTDDVLAFAAEGAPVEPMLWRRSSGKVELFQGWDAKRSYRLDADWPSHPEMAMLFEADQAARQQPRKIDWSVVAEADKARRMRTRALLEAGELRSGEDYFRAAFVFQHGRTPDDYLLAHSLATTAAARGYRPAAWIAAATLDRYLQSIGQKQIFGTQFSTPEGQPITQEPFDRTLVPDALRIANGVAVLAEQADQARSLAEQRKQAISAK